MTQQGLAEKIGVSRQTIISIEMRRETPSLTLAFEIALAYDCSIDDIFYYVEHETEYNISDVRQTKKDRQGDFA